MFPSDPTQEEPRLIVAFTVEGDEATAGVAEVTINAQHGPNYRVSEYRHADEAVDCATRLADWWTGRR